MSGGQNVFRNELTQESWVEISYVIFFGKKSGIRGSVTLNPKAGEKKGFCPTEIQLGIVNLAPVLPTGSHCEQPGRRV